MIPDKELLQRYASTGDEAAFAEIVRRRVDLVYGVALRKVAGDTALAKDVTQSVFVDLARKASTLAVHPALEGWFFTSTRFAATKAIRSASRRRTYEQETPAMHDQDPDAVDWDELRPMLDDLIGELGEREREAVVLRFFAGESFPAIAARLRISEDGARSRVDRALGRVRARLARHGVKSSSAAITMALASQAGLAAPASLAANITSAALAGATTVVVGAWPSATLPFIQLMTAHKSILVAAVIGGLIGGLGTGATLRHISNRQRAALRSLQVEDDALRDRLAAALLASPKGAATMSQPSPASPSQPVDRLDVMNSQVRMREASRDALPAAVAHPLKFRGYDTPLSAVESFVWASYHSDTEMLARSLYLDENVRATVDKIRTSLSAEFQARYPTAESLVAMCIAYDVIAHPGPNSEDYFVDPPQPDYIDPDDFRTPSGQIYHRTPDGWKYSFPAQGVALVANVLRPTK